MLQRVSVLAERMVAAHSAAMHWIYLKLTVQKLGQLDLSWWCLLDLPWQPDDVVVVLLAS